MFGKFKDHFESVKQKLEDSLDVIKEKAEEVIEVAKDAGTIASEKLSDARDVAMEKAEVIFEAGSDVAANVKYVASETIAAGYDSVKDVAGDAIASTLYSAGEVYESVSEKLDDVTSSPEMREAWCSWCGNFSIHKLEKNRRLSRSTYCCLSCNHETVKCRYCDNMAKAASEWDITIDPDSEFKSLINALKDNWNDELCAEHDGSIPDFTKSGDKILELGEFKNLMKPAKTNIYSVAKNSAVIVGGAAAIGVGTALVAPGIAAAMGTAGLLGAAGSGTAISTLSGAALTSASLAAIGTTGVAVIAATGAGLGGKAGYGIASAYLKDIPDYDFRFLRGTASDSNHRVIVINGFLTESDKDALDWDQGLRNRFIDSQVWYLNWESKTLLALGNLIGGNSLTTAGKGLLVNAAKTGSKAVAKKANAIGSALTIAELIGNPWHSAMVNAAKAGILLAEAISRTEGKTFTLLGHSLGARVALIALENLGKKSDRFIKDAVLMGGAIGVANEDRWQSAASAVTGKIFNCRSNQDDVLRYLYKGANIGLSEPAGLYPIGDKPDNVVDTDYSTLIGGHNAWKQNLPAVLDSHGLG